MDYKILGAVLFCIILIILFFSVSKFSGAYDQNYASGGCMQNNRSDPEGHVPGSWLGMTTAEKNNLKKFINNGSTI